MSGDPTTLPELKCECCGKDDDPYVGVASIPGIPMSIAWGRKCLASGAIPYWAAVANTAMVGGLQNSADWWKEIIDATLKYFEITYRKFEDDVLKDINAEREWEERMMREQEERERSGDQGTAGEDRPEAPTAG